MVEMIVVRMCMRLRMLGKAPSVCKQRSFLRVGPTSQNDMVCRNIALIRSYIWLLTTRCRNPITVLEALLSLPYRLQCRKYKNATHLMPLCCGLQSGCPVVL